MGLVGREKLMKYDLDIHGKPLIWKYKGVPLEVYRARYSKEYERREMEIQKGVEAKRVEQLKVWRSEQIKNNIKPF